MANRIKGITIEIGGNTTKLEKSLQKVNGTIRGTERELKDVNRLLKLNPGNTELLRQKQQLLRTAIEQTREKIKQEEAALKQLQAAGGTEKNQQQQNALQRELIETKNKLDMLEKEERELGAAATTATNKMERQSRAGLRVGKSLGGIKSKLMGMVGLAAAAFSVGAVVQFGKACLEASAAQTEAETKLETIMKQRMGSTDKQIQKIKDLTAAQQKQGVIGDEVQLAGAQQLATFMKQEKSLDTLIPAMNNLAAQQKGVNATSSDMVSIANLMGKAMNGNVGALKRVGITFTDAQAEVLKYGTEEEKAAMLAQVITDNVGNMNEVLAGTDSGKIQQAKNAIGDMKEEIGAKLLPILAKVAQALLPIIDGISKFIEQAGNPDTEIGAVFQDFSNFVQQCKGVLDQFNASTGKLNIGLGALKTALFLLKIPIATVTAGMIAFKGVVMFVKGLINGMKNTIKTFGQGFKELGLMVRSAVQTIVSVFQNMKAKVVGVIHTVKGAFSGIYDKFTEPFRKAYNFIKEIVDKLKNLFPISVGKIFSNVQLPHFSWGLKKAGDSKLKFPDFNPVKWYAKGGIFNNPSVIGVGERGREAVVPLDQLWAHMDRMNASSNVNINVYASPGMNVKDLANEVEKVIIQNNNRRRQAWA